MVPNLQRSVSEHLNTILEKDELAVVCLHVSSPTLTGRVIDDVKPSSALDR